MTENRLGKFKITRILIEEWRNLLPWFANCVVVEARPSFFGWIEYTAFSPLFDVVKEGDQIPMYTLECTLNEDKTLNFKAKRED